MKEPYLARPVAQICRVGVFPVLIQTVCFVIISVLIMIVHTITTTTTTTIKMLIRMVVSHLFKLVEGSPWLIRNCFNVSSLVVMMIMIMMMTTTTMMMRTETLTSSPTRTPSNFLMIRFKDLSSSSRWKSWSSSLTSSWLSWPFMPSWLWWPKLVILSHDDQKPSTWFAAIALFKLQQYQAASGVCLFSSIM